MQSTYLFWNLEISIHAGKLELFKELMQELVATTFENEPNTLIYDWQMNEDESVCHIHECYRTSADALAHLRNFFEKYAERMIALGTPSKLTVYGIPDEATKKILDDLGAVYFTSSEGFFR